MKKDSEFSSQVISINVDSKLSPVPLVKASAQITGDRIVKTAEGAIARPFDPNDLKASLDASVWHNRAIQVKATNMVGLGFTVEAKDSDEPMEDDKLFAKYPWLGQSNPDESFLEVAIEMAMDRETIGDGWWEIVRDIAGNVAEIFHVVGETVWLRKGKGTDIEGYLQRINASFKRFRRFGDTDLSNGKGELLRFKNPMIGNAYYGTPDWIPALRAISLSLSAHDYNYAFFQNSAIPAWLMLVKGGTLSAETDADVAKFFTQNFQGASEAHRLLKLEVENKDVDIQMERITAEIEDMSFSDLSDSTRDEIVSAHGTPPPILGISTPNKLGGGGELKTSLKIFKEVTIRPKQKLTEDRINNSLMLDGDKLKFNELDTAEEASTVADDTETALDSNTPGLPFTDNPEIEKIREFFKTINSVREMLQDVDKLDELEKILRKDL